MDIITISELSVETTIGVYDWEKETRQTVTIDLDVGCDTRKAGQSDNFEDALDYKAVADRVTEFVEGSRYELIEALAENIAALLLDEFNVPWIRAKISKPSALEGDTNVSVTIERSSD